MLEKNQTESKRGGARTGAGRKKGAATKKTREIANRASEAGITPLEYMLNVMRTEPDPGLDLKDLLQAITLRFEAAKAAAPYIHPRLTAVDVKGDITVRTLADEIASLNAHRDSKGHPKVA